MKIHLWALTGIAALVAIGCEPPIIKARPARPDGGLVETECASGFCTGTFDPLGLYPSASYVPQLAVAQNADTLGIAYFSPSDTLDGGYDIYYRSWTAGSVSNAEKVATVDAVQGLAIAFQPNGEPAVAYQGGDDDGADLASWKNSDAVISDRSNGTWTEHIAVNTGDEAIAGNGPSDFGQVVGVYPSIGFDSSGKCYFEYRDIHAGQFEVQDYGKSDMELAEGGLNSWNNVMLASGGVPTQMGAFGGNPKMIMVADQPAILSTSAFGSSTAKGVDLWFQRRNSNGTWTALQKILGVGDTYSAPSFAYDSVEGYGVATTELAGTQKLVYISSTNGGTSWSDDVAGTVYESGSGGWFPSLAFESDTHFPHIAYYVCALSLGVTEGLCPASEDELRISWRTPASWQSQLVDAAGGFQPWLFFLSTGKRVIVYRDIDSAEMKVAVEQ